jgi:hypothetical protein
MRFSPVISCLSKGDKQMIGGDCYSRMTIELGADEDTAGLAAAMLSVWNRQTYSGTRNPYSAR